MIDYLPFIEDTLGNRWEVLTINFCVDFGGRQAQIEVQNLTTNETRHFTYYYQSKLFVVNKGEFDLIKGAFSDSIECMFLTFNKLSKGEPYEALV